MNSNLVQSFNLSKPTILTKHLWICSTLFTPLHPTLPRWFVKEIDPPNVKDFVQLTYEARFFDKHLAFSGGWYHKKNTASNVFGPHRFYKLRYTVLNLLGTYDLRHFAKSEILILYFFPLMISECLVGGWGWCFFSINLFLNQGSSQRGQAFTGNNQQQPPPPSRNLEMGWSARCAANKTFWPWRLCWELRDSKQIFCCHRNAAPKKMVKGSIWAVLALRMWVMPCHDNQTWSEIIKCQKVFDNHWTKVFSHSSQLFLENFRYKFTQFFWSIPHPVTVTNEGL